jgi:ABC-2 type transport system ATP-binding protein
VTVLVTTHYLDEAERCQRVALMHRGQIAAIGTVDEVKRIFAGRAIVEIRTDDPVRAMQALDAMPEVEKTSLFGTAVHALLSVEAAGGPGLSDRLAAAGLRVSSETRVEPSLEDVFLDVVERSERAAEGADGAAGRGRRA